MSTSGKLTYPEEGVMGTSDFEPWVRSISNNLDLELASEVGGQSCGIEFFNCGI